MAIQRKGNPFLYKLEDKLTKNYNSVLHQEELLWFHTLTKVKHKYNKVDAFLNNEGQWINDQGMLKEMAFSFYDKPFKAEEMN